MDATRLTDLEKLACAQAEAIVALVHHVRALSAVLGGMSVQLAGAIDREQTREAALAALAGTGGLDERARALVLALTADPASYIPVPATGPEEPAGRLQ